MDIKDIHKITAQQLHPNDILVVTIDIGHMPPSRAHECMNNVKKDIERVIGTDYRIFVKDKSMQIDIINVTDIADTADTADMHIDATNIRAHLVMLQDVTDGVHPIAEDNDDDFERAKPIGTR